MSSAYHTRLQCVVVVGGVQVTPPEYAVPAYACVFNALLDVRLSMIKGVFACLRFLYHCRLWVRARV